MSQELIWELGSTSGWAEVLCHVGRVPTDPQRSGCVACRFELTARYWDREKWGLENPPEAVLVDDAVICLPQVIVPVASFRVLARTLGDWLKKPFAIHDLALCADEQRMRISFDKADDLISSIDRPVCTLEYMTRRYSQTLRFVTDETCIWRMHTGLQAWLEAHTREHDE